MCLSFQSKWAQNDCRPSSATFISFNVVWYSARGHTQSPLPWSIVQKQSRSRLTSPRYCEADVFHEHSTSSILLKMAVFCWVRPRYYPMSSWGATRPLWSHNTSSRKWKGQHVRISASPRAAWLIFAHNLLWPSSRAQIRVHKRLPPTLAAVFFFNRRCSFSRIIKTLWKSINEIFLTDHTIFERSRKTGMAFFPQFLQGCFAETFCTEPFRFTIQC